MKSFIALLFLLPTALSFAQKTDSTTMIVEHYVCFEADCDDWDIQQEFTPIKIVQSDATHYSKTPFVAWIKQQMRSGQWKAYGDADLSQPIGQEEALDRLLITDTIVLFDPVTYEEEMRIVSVHVLEEADAFKVRQSWHYNEKSEILESRLLAISPRIGDQDILGDRPDLEGRVWFALPAAKDKAPKIQDKNVPLIAQINYFVSENQFGANRTGLKNRLYRGLFESNPPSYYNSDYPARKIDPAFASNLFFSTDTVITVDPETYTESLEVINRHFTLQDMTYYKAIQKWYVDLRIGTIYCQLEAFAPCVPITDEYGTLIYPKPLFYWRRGQ
ncbi:MAG TPA: hypothetical protein PKA00_11730 [Saprospiraceae bacterium]|nr:hypothetical protein [Saprospiraceae bacterium]HMQ83574.1 hypothetical protein [Saprospiraceae bacterium]